MGIFRTKNIKMHFHPGKNWVKEFQKNKIKFFILGFSIGLVLAVSVEAWRLNII